MGKFSGAQLARINRKSKHRELSPDEVGGELNIIPFLDIVVNVLMFVLATISTIFTATLPVPAPRAGAGGGGAPNSIERLNITVMIRSNGFQIGARGGFLAPGCTTVGRSQITVPNRGQTDQDGYAYDFDALTRCMQAMRQQFAQEIADDHSINVSPNGDIPYGVMVRTLDAVREIHPGSCTLAMGNRHSDYSNPDCMFPDVTLGVVRN